MSTHFFGIRHHGPGSARSLLNALADLAPDVLVVECPQDAEAHLDLALDAEIQPPVALLLHDAQQLDRACFYPFADFSPEWQALRYALAREIPVRCMDLPQSIHMGIAHADSEAAQAEQAESAPESDAENEGEAAPSRPADPLDLLAEAAGFEDGERWWEYLLEERNNDAEVFEAIAEAMHSVREAIEAEHPPSLREQRREAFMRKTLRAVEKEGFERIAVVCGAWHVPALKAKVAVKDDNALLKGLPKRKTQVTWVPWSFPNLTYVSGYSAGIHAPGWYQHLWDTHHQDKGQRARAIAVGWLSKVAQALRDAGLDTSSASVIEGVRAAEALAALRERPLPGLDELNEAALATLCFGNSEPLALVSQKLYVGNALGQVPEHTPMVPLQRDLTALQKSLRLAPNPTRDEKALDLRKDMDLARSQLLHRLQLLDIPWGTPAYNSSTGTFKESWLLQWEPEFSLKVIEASLWGVTVAEAAHRRCQDQIAQCEDLSQLSKLLDQLLKADLPETVAQALARLDAMAAVAGDALQLMRALPALSRALRYGTVRRFDSSLLAHVVDGLVVRLCLGFPAACLSLDDDAAQHLFEELLRTADAIRLLQNEEHLAQWQASLQKVLQQANVHGLIAGRCCRLLLDAGVLDSEQGAMHLHRALSAAVPVAEAGAWLEGFLRGSGLLLVHDKSLLQLIDAWLCGLSEAQFIESLPLLRRTFGSFSNAERRQLGQSLKPGNAPQADEDASMDNWDHELAAQALPLTCRLLGLDL